MHTVIKPWYCTTRLISILIYFTSFLSNLNCPNIRSLIFSAIWSLSLGAGLNEGDFLVNNSTDTSPDDENWTRPLPRPSATAADQLTPPISCISLHFILMHWWGKDWNFLSSTLMASILTKACQPQSTYSTSIYTNFKLI